MFKFMRWLPHRAAKAAQPFFGTDREGQPPNTDVVIRQAARTRLTAEPNQQISIPVSLHYSSADPLAVHIDFPALVSSDGKEMTWSFARDLLENGLHRPSGIGDVHVWPYAHTHTMMEFRTPEGKAVAKFDTPVIQRFLLRSYVVVGRGSEDVGQALDRGLAALLDEV
ncbi:SsgA family sporulation/cell division regulator [Streptomyces sp. NPDC059680]|uniref:SsgA family sporulation/cell division regulator n=1 Tax=Streptomyces sp. NPDC059680 TaxID=3346904 RepID=UPI0036BE5111